jgi:hypothetical protein
MKASRMPSGDSEAYSTPGRAPKAAATSKPCGGAAAAHNIINASADAKIRFIRPKPLIARTTHSATTGIWQDPLWSISDEAAQRRPILFPPSHHIAICGA